MSPNAPSATKKQPTLKLHDIKGTLLPLNITEKVQNQIYALCQRVHEDEWSGTLFYTTEGEFGEEGFKIQAEEIYLQDIGSAAYTEYDPSNPEFIKFLMDRPDLMGMRMGHVHSHNKMGVFFSGTDSDELVTNSEFHNYYLSLIVNNRNHMVAKVAFRGKAAHETVTQIVYKDTEGTSKTKSITTKTEEDAVYAYNCHITIPNMVTDDFDARYFSIVEEVRKKKEEFEKARKSAVGFRSAGGGTVVINPGGRAYQGFDGTKRYREAGLFDDHEDWMKEEKPKSKKSVKDKGRVDGRTYSMLSKLLKLDPLYEGTLMKALSMISEEFCGAVQTTDPNYYFDLLDKRSVTFYLDSFPEDINLLGFDKVMEDCTEILTLHEDQFPKLIPTLITALKVAKLE